MTDLVFLQDSSQRSRSTSPVKYDSGREDRGIANIVIISGLPMASEETQIQALEVSSLMIRSSADFF